MSPERLHELALMAANYDDYDARVDVAELVVEVERLERERASILAIVFALAPIDVVNRVHDAIRENV